MTLTDIRLRVRQFLLKEVLPGEDPALLTNETPLVTGGILDSISTMKLATFLEQEFGIELDAHELSADYLNTVVEIEKLVQAKRAGR
jgi:acyl carrier protein